MVPRSMPSAEVGVPVGQVELLGDSDRPGSWMLLVGGIAQSHVDLDDPAHLELEYVRRIGHLIDLAAPSGTPLRLLHLGAGGLTLARYAAVTRPGSVQVAVEADKKVADLVRRRLPLGEAWPVEVQVADARAALTPMPAGSFDVVVADAFEAGRTPAHLTSAEFTAEAARVLAPRGLFAVNVGDGPPLSHVRSRIAAVRTLFRHTCVIAEPGVLHGRRFGNLVVAASGHELPVAELTRRIATDPFPAGLLAGEALDQFVAGAAAITDASAEPSPAPPRGAFG